jgi:hypothetical protein
VQENKFEVVIAPRLKNIDAAEITAKAMKILAPAS